ASFPVVSMAVVLLAAVPNFPFRGRLYFLLYRTNPIRALTPMDETASWFQSNRHYPYRYPEDCWIITDDATHFLLAAHLGRIIDVQRLEPIGYARTLTTVAALKRVVDEKHACGVLAAIRKNLPK